ncbi:uncharacterized protein LOC127095614 [Lathyrus oleraceus]|uniref:uncharacterized protein LOC127095614 n=1 Tax=Pisum sativum TaxID=3888 RepID=UPI0021D0E196|nr:uncharacterized protein LOC127095614 [Pisum sativum]
MASDAVVSSIKVMNQDLVKLDRFDGTNYTRWQDKMTFLLTALKVHYVLDPDLQPIPEPTENDSEELKKERKKRKEDELLCRGHILNTLSDRLYDLYTDNPSATEIWKALEFKFKAEEEDSKPILPQVHELQVLVNKIKAVKIDIPETFQVGAIIAKLPPSWKGYRKKLLHSSEDFSLEKIQKHLRIEEESKEREKSEPPTHFKTNAVTNKGKKRHDGIKSHLGPKKEHNKFKNSGGHKGPKNGCFVCGKPGHYARDCRQNKAKNEINAIRSDDDTIATVSEIMAIKGKVQGWWYDTCATVHVTYDKAVFKTYSEAIDGQEVQMGNEVRSKVVGTGSVELNFTSGKKVTLDFKKCELCVESKMIKKPFKSVERKTKLLDLVHSDLCEFNGMLTRGGNRYFITFIDDSSRYTHVYLLKHKDDAFNAFKTYKAEVENQLNKSIKVLRSDRGGEYFSIEFDAFCEEHGRAPNIGYFKVWGCVAYYKNMDPKRTKLGPRGIRCAFVGYAQHSKAYRLLNLESNVIVESRDVEFFENLITKDKGSESATNKESHEDNSSRIVEIQTEGTPIIIEPQPEPRISKRIRKKGI